MEFNLSTITSGDWVVSISGKNGLANNTNIFGEVVGLYYTTNGGESWAPTDTPALQSLVWNFSISGQNGLAGSINLYYTINGGKTWGQPNITTNTGFSISGQNAVAVATGIYYATFPLPCLLATSSILTLTSYKSIKDIKAGDMVISAFSKTPRKVIHCGYKIVNLSNTPLTNHPMVIPKNHFKEGVPHKDVYISGHHRVICPTSNNAFTSIQTFKLGDFKTLTETEILELTSEDVVKYYHIVLEDDIDAVFCDGLPIETLALKEWTGVDNI